MSAENPSPTESFVQQMLGTTSDGISGADTNVLDLNDALGRLRSFRASWNHGDVIDEVSGLTANVIDLVLSFVDDAPALG